jgi:hypothetical protein
MKMPNFVQPLLPLDLYKKKTLQVLILISIWTIFRQLLTTSIPSTKEKEHDPLPDKEDLYMIIGSLAKTLGLRNTKSLLTLGYMGTTTIIRACLLLIDLALYLIRVIDIQKHHLNCLVANYFSGRRWMPLLTMRSKA